MARTQSRPENLQFDLRLLAIPIAGEIKPGDSIANHLLASLRKRRLSFQAGDILIVKHKIISKSEGRLVDLSTIQPSPASVAWAKQYNLDPRVIELALRESRDRKSTRLNSSHMSIS